MSVLPRISIVTPSFNQAQFVDRTMRSVLEQDYPNVEYIVIDGASTDGTPSIIARHAGWKRSHALPVIDHERRLLGALRYSTFRAIETELGQDASGPDVDQTASALAELCALGASAMTRFIGAALALEGVPPERADEQPRARRSILPGPPSARRSVLPPPEKKVSLSGMCAPPNDCSNPSRTLFAQTVAPEAKGL